MKKRLLFIFILNIALYASNGRYMTRSGFVSFYSSAPLEDIYAENNQVSCLLDTQTGEFAFIVPIKAFQFEKSLMQEHFNENYMESDLFPSSTFSGKIESWETIQQTDSFAVKVQGHLMIHGIKQMLIEDGQFKRKDGYIFGESTFTVRIADFGIKIPKVVFNNIAEEVEINIRVRLEANE